MADNVLTASGQVTLDASGNGSVTVGPGIAPDRSSLRWNITGVVVRTSRPGAPPIPRVRVTDQLGRDEGLSYDGSFDQGAADIALRRGEFITATWAGGQAGDVATLTVSGTKQ